MNIDGKNHAIAEMLSENSTESETEERIKKDLINSEKRWAKVRAMLSAYDENGNLIK